MLSCSAFRSSSQRSCSRPRRPAGAAEVIRKRAPWRSLESVELATAEWVDWWNQRRLHSAIHDMPPAEFEALYHQQRVVAAAA